MNIRSIIAIVALAAVIALSALAPHVRAQTATPRTPATTRPVVKKTLVAWSKASADQVMANLAQGGSVAEAEQADRGIALACMAWGPTGQFESLREPQYVSRILWLVSGEADAAKQQELVKFLRTHDAFTRALLSLIRRSVHSREGILTMLNRLRSERENKLETYSQLAAAICIVHSRPLTAHINENKVQADDPIAIFDYFIANENRMICGIRTVPAQLLIHVVDSTAPVQDMKWALDRYAGDRKVGERFFDIKYDFNGITKDKTKAVTEHGLSLPNILTYGGVCVDQAYFAASVAKSIGVPSCMAHASSGQAGHAWVGFLQFDNRRCWWNFDVGRYDAYKGIRGTLDDPLTHKPVPDSYISLGAELIGVRPADHQLAIALADYADGLAASKDGEEGLAIAAPENVLGLLAKPRTNACKTALELLDQAIKLAAGERECWVPLLRLARQGKLTLAEKRQWSDRIIAGAGEKYPDFAFEMLVPMIETVTEPAEQDRLWNFAFTTFRARADLAAACRMKQAQILEQQNKPERAIDIYWEIVQRYANAGPFVLTALEKCEDALVRTKRQQQIPAMYQQAWAQMKPPTYTGMAEQTNWYRIGTRLAGKLETAGDAQRARAVRDALDAAISTKPSTR